VRSQNEGEKQELKAEYPISNTEYPTDEVKAGRQNRAFRNQNKDNSQELRTETEVWEQKQK